MGGEWYCWQNNDQVSQMQVDNYRLCLMAIRYYYQTHLDYFEGDNYTIHFAPTLGKAKENNVFMSIGPPKQKQVLMLTSSDGEEYNVLENHGEDVSEDDSEADDGPVITFPWNPNDPGGFKYDYRYNRTYNKMDDFILNLTELICENSLAFDCDIDERDYYSEDGADFLSFTGKIFSWKPKFSRSRKRWGYSSCWVHRSNNNIKPLSDHPLPEEYFFATNFTTSDDSSSDDSDSLLNTFVCKMTSRTFEFEYLVGSSKSVNFNPVPLNQIDAYELGREVLGKLNLSNYQYKVFELTLPRGNMDFLINSAEFISERDPSLGFLVMSYDWLRKTACLACKSGSQFKANEWLEYIGNNTSIQDASDEMTTTMVEPSSTITVPIKIDPITSIYYGKLEGFPQVEMVKDSFISHGIQILKQRNLIEEKEDEYIINPEDHGLDPW